MERIHELLEQLMNAVQEKFPEMTNVRVSAHTDGYRSIAVERIQEDDNLPVEAWKCRELMDQHKFNGKWSDDRSAEQNEYYRQRKTLLEEGENNERMAG